MTLVTNGNGGKTWATLKLVIKLGEPGDQLSAGSVAVNESMTKRLGESDPERVVKSVRADVFLYGERVHSHLHATMNFIDGLE